MALRSRWVVGVGVAAMSCLAACGPAQRESAAGPSTTPVRPSTTTTDATLPEACPPGCALPSDDDAITVLASSATLVAIVDVQDIRGSGSTATAAIKVARTLQGNPHRLVYAPTRSSVGLSLAQTGNIVDGGDYLVFMSYNRGGPCLSSLFSFEPATQVATLIESNDGPNGAIMLPGRMLTVPSSITLSDLRVRMYPTGGVVYPADTEEWYCPGP
jgi:hypothetical protein